MSQPSCWSEPQHNPQRLLVPLSLSVLDSASLVLQLESRHTCSVRMLAALEDDASAPGSDLLGDVVSEDLEEPAM